MKNWKLIICVSSALVAFTMPALAKDPASADPAKSPKSGKHAIEEVVVTARRTKENIQNVPIAVSVISSQTIQSVGIFNPTDLPKYTPGLTVTGTVGDRSNLTYTIRGQGFAYGTLFPAVITYVDEVPVPQLMQGQFFDIQNIQVLRGPQGVDFGRVTDGGNVMVTFQKPKDEFGGYIGTKLGEYNLRTINGALNVPIVSDKVLFRVAFETTKRDGFTTNIYNGQKLDDVDYQGYRAALTLRPTESLENTTTVSYLSTNDDGTSVVYSGFNPNATGLIPNIATFSFLFAGAYGIDANGQVGPYVTGMTPLSATSYAAAMQAQLDAQNARGTRAVNLVYPSYTRRKNLYAINKTSFDFSNNMQLTNILGYVLEKEYSSQNFEGSNSAVVVLCNDSCPGNTLPRKDTKQVSDELRLTGTSFNEGLKWALGAYADKQSPNGPAAGDSLSIGVLNREGVAYVTTKSRAVYGSVEFSATDNLTLNGGVRYTHDTFDGEETTYISPIDGGQTALYNLLTGPLAPLLGFPGPLPPATANQIVAATFAPIPHGQCVDYGAGSILYGGVSRPCLQLNGSWNVWTWSTGVSYQTDSGQLLYAKVSKGYRPGGINFTAPQGVDPRYSPETDVSIELGVKADFNFNGGAFLRTNFALYTDSYKDIQKLVVLPSAVPVSVVRNVDDAKIQGIEGEITFVPVESLHIGANFAYTDAKFDEMTPPTVGNPCDPTQPTTDGFCSENRFNSVPRFQYALSFSYTLPLPSDIGTVSIGGRLFHQSSQSLSDTSVLNPRTIEPARSTVDMHVNWDNVAGQPVDLSLFVTNLTNKLYRVGTNNLMQNSSIGVVGDFYAPPRMWGATLQYNFGGHAP